MSSPPRRVWRLDGTGLLSATMTSQNPFAAWSSGLATLYNTFLPYSHLFFTFTCPTSSLAESTIIRPICTVGPLRLSLYVPCGSDRASPDEPHEALRPKQQFPLAHRYHSTPGRSRHGGSASFLVAVSLCGKPFFYSGPPLRNQAMAHCICTIPAGTTTTHVPVTDLVRSVCAGVSPPSYRFLSHITSYTSQVTQVCVV